MTEAEWLSCNSSDEMMAFLRGRHGLGRKRRLLAVACCRRVWAWMPEECRPAVEVAQRIADGQVTEEERWAAFVAAGEAYPEQGFPESWAGYCAYRAVERPSDYDEPNSWANDAAVWVVQTAAQPASWIGRRWDEVALKGERAAIADVIRDIFGNPFRPARIDPSVLTPGVVGLAQDLYQRGAFDRMALLGTALEEAGCRDASILEHCRQPTPHVRGCWVVDLLLGKQ